MKAALALIGGLLAAVAIAMAGKPAAPTVAPTAGPAGTTAVLVMELRDGTRVKGRLTLETLTISCPYGKLNVRIADIRGIVVERLSAGGETWQQVKLEMRNGDKLTGRPGVNKLDLETAYGRLSVPLTEVVRAEVLPAGACEPGAVVLEGPTYYPVAANPHSLAVVDLNHDGILDVVSTETPNSGTHLSVLYGRGKGAFGGRADFVCGGRPQGLAAGDFDRDGHVDIAVTRQHATCVTIMKGEPDGTLVAGADLPTKDSEPGYPRVIDLNGDGRLDLVVCNYRSSSVSVFYGQPDGTLGNRKDFDTAPFPGAVSFADFDHDGKIDMAVANQDGENNGVITILHGRGDGTFDRRQDVPMPGWRINGVVAADFNGDGQIDLATGEQSDGRIRVRYGAADGSFGPVVYFATSGKTSRVDETSAVDFNGDGRIDLVSANTGTHTIDILFDQPDGSFGDRKTYTLGDGPGQVIACDLNGDGRPDLVAASYGDAGQLAVFLSVPGRTPADAAKIGVSAVGPKAAVTGPVLHYTFDKDEGGKVTDQSGRCNHGTVHSATWTAKGKAGGAYEFDGKDDYIELGPSNLYKSKGQLSACAWVNIRGKVAIVLSNYHGGGAYKGQFFFACNDVGGIDVLFGQGPNTYVRYISKARSIPRNEWHHVAFTYDERRGNGNRIKLYLDGEELGGCTIQSEGNGGPVLDIAENLRIMAHRDTPTGTLSDGLVDEVMIFNRALSAEEIKRVYRSAGAGGDGVKL